MTLRGNHCKVSFLRPCSEESSDAASSTVVDKTDSRLRQQYSKLNILCEPPASLLPFAAQGIRQDTRRLVGSHALENGDKAVDALLDRLAVVLVSVGGLGLPLVDGLLHRA